jgi:Calcium binding
MARAKDDVREQRITMEAIVDAYDSGERAMGWYYYLDGKLKVPFKARCRIARPISLLKIGEEVEVLGMAARRKCLSGLGKAGNESLYLWCNCNHCRKIEQPKRLSVIGSIG